MKAKVRKAVYKARPRKLSIVVDVDKKNEVLEYDKDFSRWANSQAKFLKKREFEKLHIKNLIEEIEDLSKRERDKLVSHLEKKPSLKNAFGSKRYISKFRKEISLTLQTNLKSVMNLITLFIFSL